RGGTSLSQTRSALSLIFGNRNHRLPTRSRPPHGGDGTGLDVSAGRVPDSAMDFTIPEEIERLCDGWRRFMDEDVCAVEGAARGWKLEAGAPAYPPAIREVQRRAKELGYWAFHLPAEAGGAGIPFMYYVLVNEILGRSPLAPVCVGSQAPDSGNA